MLSSGAHSQISEICFSASCHLSLPLALSQAVWPGVRSRPLTEERLALWSVLCDRHAGLWPGSSSRPTAVLRRLDWGSFEDHASGLGLVKSGEPSDVHLAVSRGGCQGRSPTLKPCGAEYVRPHGVAWGGWEIQARVLVGAAATTLWSRVLRSPLRVGGWEEGAVHMGACVGASCRALAEWPHAPGPPLQEPTAPSLGDSRGNRRRGWPSAAGLSEGPGLRCSLGRRVLCDGLLWAPGQGRGGGGVGVTHCGLLVCVLTPLSSCSGNTRCNETRC